MLQKVIYAAHACAVTTGGPVASEFWWPAVPRALASTPGCHAALAQAPCEAIDCSHARSQVCEGLEIRGCCAQKQTSPQHKLLRVEVNFFCVCECWDVIRH